MSNYKDLKTDKFKDNTNIVDSGTEGIKIPVGTTAQRGSTQGQWRFNSTTGFFEGFDGSAFQSLAPTPTVTSVDVTEVDSGGGGNQTFVIGGTNFSSGMSVKFIGNDASEITASTVTKNSSIQLTAVIAQNLFVNAKEPYDIKVISTSGTQGTLLDQINVDSAPTFNTASGSLGSVFDGTRGSASFTISATDAEGDTVAYSVQSGSLPAGSSLNSSSGVISGFNAVGSDTTSNFTIRATAGGKTSDRAFSILVKAPTFSVFNSNGTFTVPSGLTNVAILVVAGGGAGGATTGSGGGGSGRGSGGGAGGLIYIPSWNLSGASSYSVVVGAGGTSSYNTASNGANSTVSGGSKTLTAIGGGSGGHGDNTNNPREGGSGGSPWYPTYTGKAGTQPTNTSDGVTTYNSTGYGNAGGNSSSSAPYGGGGGGATSRGQHYNEGQQGGTGFNGGTYGFGSYGESGYFASGGTAATVFGSNGNTRIGGGGAGYQTQSHPSNSAANGQANTGGGGGSGGFGGSGVVIFKY